MEITIYDKDAEMRLLSACMVFPELILRYGHLDERIFYDRNNREIRKSLKQMGKSSTIDPGTLASLVRRESEIVVDDYLLEIQLLMSTESNAEIDVETVLYYNKLRRLFALTSKMQAMISDKEQLTEVYKHISKMQSVIDESTFKITSFADIIDKVLEENIELKASRTGLTLLDDKLTGYKPGQLIVVGARPGMGKTTFMLNTAFNQAVSGRKTIFFTLEMSNDEIAKRLFSIASSIPYKTIDNKKYSEKEYESLKKFQSVLKNSSLSVIDNALTFEQIIYCIRDEHRRNGLDVVYIDYLQLLGGGSDNRVQELANITKRLKLLAKELSISIVIGSQLNRGNEKRVDKRPALSDLRESGSIEQDADIVMLLYREGYYDSYDSSITIEVSLAKHRNGEGGIIILAFHGPSMQILDMPQEAAIREAVTYVSTSSGDEHF